MTRSGRRGLPPAPGYDEVVTPENMQHGARALGQLSIGRGTRFLDVAAGSGALLIDYAAHMAAERTAT
jgi:ubiquinone/menaquinone biosynthesis C-methylase UbiE